MNEVKLTEAGQADIEDCLTTIRRLSDQIRTLEMQRADVVKTANYIWKSEQRGVELSSIMAMDLAELEQDYLDVPDLISSTGDILNIKDGIVSWEHVGDDKE